VDGRIQYFLYEDVPLVRGHTFFPTPVGADDDLAAAVLARPRHLPHAYGAGDVGGLISVDVSDWDTPGRFINKPAKQCTPTEIAQEIWQQLKAGLNGPTSARRP